MSRFTSSVPNQCAPLGPTEVGARDLLGRRVRREHRARAARGATTTRRGPARPAPATPLRGPDARPAPAGRTGRRETSLPASRCRSSGLTHACSSESDTRVEPGVDDVGEQLDDDEHRDGEQQQHLHERVVTAGDRLLDQKPPRPGQAKIDSTSTAPPSSAPNWIAENRQRRRQRIRQRLGQDDPPPRDAERRAVMTYGCRSSVRSASVRNGSGRPPPERQADRRKQQVLHRDVGPGEEPVRRRPTRRAAPARGPEDEHQQRPGDEGRAAPPRAS